MSHEFLYLVQRGLNFQGPQAGEIFEGEKNTSEKKSEKTVEK